MESDISLRPDGYLSNLSDWNEEVAVTLAQRDGIELSSDHWDIINIIRGFYNEYNISPIRKLLKKEIAKKLGAIKARDESLDALFPNDVSIQGCRIAGVPRPMFDVELETSSKASSVPFIENKLTSEFEFNGKTISVFPNGNLVNMDDWDESLAEFLAQEENITLTEEHWEVIHYLRHFYFKYGIAPMVKLLMKHMLESFGPIKSNKEYLYNLFPKGPARQGSRIAGLPEPQGCIDP